MIISVASGKGGTGKTTVAVNLALSLNENIQFLDCDVEEPNAAIFLKPKIKKNSPVFIPVPVVDQKKCTHCGKCAAICEYHALAVLPKETMVFAQLCHGCGGCTLICPEDAIREKNRKIGVVRTGVCEKNILFADGILDIGEPMAPPLIRAVKNKIRENKTVIIDAPPGTSCPVIASVKDSDFCILVTEPTPFGLNDLLLVVETLRKLKISFGVVVNRFDIGDEKIYNYCKDENIPIMMQIPFKKEIAVAYSKGIPIIEAIPEYIKQFEQLFKNIKKG